MDSENKNIIEDIQSKLEYMDINEQTIDKPMEYAEKMLLCENIKKLEPQHLKGVVDIVINSCDLKGEVFEFDIDKLPPRICHELDKYIKNCLKTQLPKENKNCEVIEIQNEILNKNNMNIPVESEEKISSSETHNPQIYQRINEDSKKITEDMEAL